MDWILSRHKAPIEFVIEYKVSCIPFISIHWELEVFGLSASFETANKMLQRELMKPEYQPPKPHHSIWKIIWNHIVSFFHLDRIRFHHFPLSFLKWMGVLLICGIVVFIVVALLRRQKRGREVVFVSRRKEAGAVPALDNARMSLSHERLSEFFVFLVQACVEFALSEHFVRFVKPGQTIRVLEREISRKADSSFYNLFHDIRMAAESVHFAHQQLSLQECMVLLERMEAVYKEGVS